MPSSSATSVATVEVRSGDAASGTVTEHERRPRLLRSVQMHARRAVWGFDLSCHGFA